jgi:DNA-binding MarR family transcriptional regulator
MSNHKLGGILAAIEHFRSIDSDAPARAISTFLSVAENPGKPIQWYMSRLNLSQSSMSRNVAYLSRWKKYGVAGMDLVEANDDPQDRRFKLVTLTPRGTQLADALRQL